MANKVDSYDFISEDRSVNFSASLQKRIENIIEQEGYVKYKLEKKMVPQVGNFLSFLYEVDIIGETTFGEKETPLFIKERVPVEKIRLADISDLYFREVFVYDDFSSMYHTLQDAARIPDHEKFTFLKSYEGNNDAIIMENLYRKGFKTYSATQVVPLKFAELSIKELAKFHALSYITKKINTKYFNDKIRTIKNPFTLDSDWEGFVHNICAVTAQVVKDEAKDIIRHYAPTMMHTYRKYIKDSVPSNGCLCHGDYKILNILVKEEDGEPIEVKPIDYQLVYYGNPVDDFLFFIFTGTDREFRKKHLNNLKDLYFESFAKFLRLFNLDVNSTYSRQEFDDDYEERLGLGLVFGLYLSAFTFSRPEDGFDIQTRFLSELPIVPDELFAERVRGIVDDYIDWGYL